MIDYNNLYKSIEYFEEKGFERIEVPWIVPEAIDSITRDLNKNPYITSGGNLIASGEQGFLYLMLKGNLPKGKYCTITPCFRDDRYDFLHCPYFMKSELIIVDPEVKKYKSILSQLVSECINFFSSFFPLEKIRQINTKKDSIDIEIIKDGIWYEVGSYGFRVHKHLRWIYGTACAEPRLTRLIKNI